MVYKTLGDRLAEGLGYRDQALTDRLTAGDHFEQLSGRLLTERTSAPPDSFREALRP